MVEPDDVIGPFTLVSFRPQRNATLDTLRWARKRHQIPVLLEIDVTVAREAIRGFRKRTGKGLSLTAWIVACVARAAAEHPRVHAVRQGRKRLVLFDEVDVAVLVERAIGGDAGSEKLPMPFVVRRANEKGPSEIHEEIRRAQDMEVSPGSPSMERGISPRAQSLFFRLPAWMRDAVYWRWLLRDPMRIKGTMGTVVVSAAGMAAPGVLSWGIPLSIHPLTVGVGGITRRDGAGGRKAEVLALTVLFDHAVVDGAPVGRFIHRLHQLITRAESLTNPDPGGRPHPERGQAGESGSESAG